MDTFKSLGLDPELLDEDDLAAMEKFGKDCKLPTNGDPNQMIAELRKAGIDVDKIIKKMRGNVVPKQSKRIKRNASCPCGSGIKYKKCCLNID